MSAEKPNKPEKEKKEKPAIQIPTKEVLVNDLRNEVLESLQRGEKPEEWIHKDSGAKYHILKTASGFIPVEYVFGSDRNVWEISSDVAAAKKSLANYHTQLKDNELKEQKGEVKKFPHTQKKSFDEIKVQAAAYIPSQRPVTQPAQVAPVTVQPQLQTVQQQLGVAPPIQLASPVTISSAPVAPSTFLPFSPPPPPEPEVEATPDELKHARDIQQLLEKHDIKKSEKTIIREERDRLKLIPKVKEQYVAHMHIGTKNEYQIFSFLVKNGHNVLLPGPSGTGKTMVVKSFCAGWNPVTKQYDQEKYPLMIVPCKFQNTNLVGEKGMEARRGVATAVTVWHDGPLIEAMRKGYVILLDEINALLPEDQIYLTTALSERAMRLPNDENEVVIADPRFRIIAAYNPGFRGTQPFNEAIFNRFGPGVINFEYLNEQEELDRFKALLKDQNDQIPITDDFQNMLKKVIKDLRRLGEDKRRQWATSRNISDLAYQIAEWVDEFHTFPSTDDLRVRVITALASTDDPKLNKEIEDQVKSDFKLVTNYFGKFPDYAAFAEEIGQIVLAKARKQGITAVTTVGNASLGAIDDEVKKALKKAHPEYTAGWDFEFDGNVGNWRTQYFQTLSAESS